MLAVDRRLVDLEVARVDDDAGRRVNRQRDAIGDAVRHADEFDFERPDGHAVARPHGLQLVRAVEAVFDELRLDERQRERCAVHGAVDVRQHVRHAADVILMAVRQHERGGPPLLQVGEVGDDLVDTQQFRVGKHHARVDDDRRVTPAECQHFMPELAEPTEWDRFEHQESERINRPRLVPGGTFASRPGR